MTPKEALKELASWIYAEQLESGCLTDYEEEHEEEYINKLF